MTAKRHHRGVDRVIGEGSVVGLVNRTEIRIGSYFGDGIRLPRQLLREGGEELIKLVGLRRS